MTSLLVIETDHSNLFSSFSLASSHVLIFLSLSIAIKLINTWTTSFTIRQGLFHFGQLELQARINGFSGELSRCKLNKKCLVTLSLSEIIFFLSEF